MYIYIYIYDAMGLYVHLPSKAVCIPLSKNLDSSQRSLIWYKCEVTWEQGQIRALVLITLQRNLIASIRCSCAEHQV